MAAPKGNKNRLGKKMSLETREKIRLAKLANPTKYWQGKKRSAETKEKIKRTKEGVPSPQKGMPRPHLQGERSKLWKGGTPMSSGYLMVGVGGKHKLLHRYLMEVHLGRELTKDEEVHHRDGNKTNNDIANLEIMDRRQHRRLHISHLFPNGTFYNRWSGKRERLKNGI